MRALGIGAAFVAATFAAACGFRLQGSEPLPPSMQRPWVDAADRYSPLYAALVSRLAAAGATLAPDPAGASAVVRLHEDRTGRELLSVTAGNKPGEYEVYYSVEYSVSAAGTELLPRQQLVLRREYGYDEAAVLAKEREEQSLRVALADELAALIVRRLVAL